MKTLLIDDDRSLCMRLQHVLKAQGVFCDTFNVVSAALSTLESSLYDVILLDLNIPEMPGPQIIQHIRNHRNPRIKHTPIIILSAEHAINEKKNVLDLGADDYMTKPLSITELVARLRALMRRRLGHSHHILSTGNLVVNLNSGQVFINRQYIHLTSLEYKLIVLLIMHMNSVIQKDTILSYLYTHDERPDTTKVIDVLVCKIRKKIENEEQKLAQNVSKYIIPEYICTAWGRGYMMQSIEVTDNTFDIEEQISPFIEAQA